MRRFRFGIVDLTALAEALALCTAASILLRVLRFSRVARHLGRHMRESPPSQPGATGASVQRVRWAVAKSAQLLPWKPLCLPQAVTAQWMLRLRGIPSTLYLGADPANRYAAHAWVRVGGVIMTGGDDPRRYTVVSTFS
ncbi:MAG TPA: lasso peptide biosynthesis B2 protein [Longimicrobiales bacterium]|nr:lasso peptide biosynthesis B2 protein [Longimicrobiales bacterium]